jgi:hypothetical protein
MTVALNHTIVWCRDQQVSATFLTEMLGRPPATRFGPFLIVELDNGTSLDFHEVDGEVPSQHYAFIVSGESRRDLRAHRRAGSSTGPIHHGHSPA